MDPELSQLADNWLLGVQICIAENDGNMLPFHLLHESWLKRHAQYLVSKQPTN